MGTFLGLCTILSYWVLLALLKGLYFTFSECVQLQQDEHWALSCLSTSVLSASAKVCATCLGTVLSFCTLICPSYWSPVLITIALSLPPVPRIPHPVPRCTLFGSQISLVLSALLGMEPQRLFFMLGCLKTLKNQDP